ncbi:MAG TPA: DoxX family protein [Jatrophihabitantaceae bacterium]|nr:DoxX family protein [Jatrophihabitantaceae bacterium]
MFVVTVILTIVLCVAYLASGAMKIAGLPMARDAAEHFGIPWNGYRGIGVLEWAAVAGLLIGLGVPALGVAAATGIVLLMIGAMIFHLRAGDPPKVWGPVPVLAILAILYIIFRIGSA